MRRDGAALLVASALCGLPFVRGDSMGSAVMPTPPRIEVVFVLDTTGSMTGLLRRRQGTDLVDRDRSGLRATRPRADARAGRLPRPRRFVRHPAPRISPPTWTRCTRSSWACRRRAAATPRRASTRALYEAVTEISWSADPHAYRAVFLVGDAPPHMDYPDDVTYPALVPARRATAASPSTPSSAGRTTPTATVWTEIAQQGEGAFVRLQQSGGTPMIATPYDKGIAAMAKQLDETRLAYGNDAERAAVEQRRERAEHIYDHSTLGEQASRGVFNVTATGRSNQYGSKDLVGDCQRGVVKLEDIDSTELPEPLRSMTAVERRAYFEHQVKLREDLELTIQSLAAQRRDYLAGELAKRGSDQGSLRARLLAAMQSQAKRHGLELGSCPTVSR